MTRTTDIFFQFLIAHFVLLIAISKSVAQEESTYPKTAIYFSVVHPLLNFTRKETSFNFDHSYTVGFPTGINFLKSEKIGFSFEITPFIKFENHENSVANFLFHPGVLIRMKNGFGITGRLAFETSGRYGFTSIVSKAIMQNDNRTIFIAMPFPVRLGNNKPLSFGFGIQVGIVF